MRIGAAESACPTPEYHDVVVSLVTICFQLWPSSPLSSMSRIPVTTTCPPLVECTPSRLAVLIRSSATQVAPRSLVRSTVPLCPTANPVPSSRTCNAKSDSSPLCASVQLAPPVLECRISPNSPAIVMTPSSVTSATYKCGSTPSSL